ncbi:MAG: SpoIIE family protein phosphatase, partial [Chloroflexota bacterium]
RVNDLLYPDIPPRMFVTCLYAVLDPETGHLQYANAGHDLPYCRRKDGVDELRATGMPLGLMPGMTYEEKELVVAPGETVLFYSDGLAEAHDPQGEMFGFPRLQALMADHPGGAPLIDYLLDKLADFTQPDWEQEDDVTLMTLQRQVEIQVESSINGRQPVSLSWERIAELKIASQPGNERQALEHVSSSLREIEIPSGQLEKLKTAVAEATMNAMEHGNQYQEDVPVQIEVLKSDKAVAIRITDQGNEKLIPQPEIPDLEAKLAGEQSPRGWGLFLIQNMVDELNIHSSESHHTMELIIYLAEGESHDNSPSTL